MAVDIGVLLQKPQPERGTLGELAVQPRRSFEQGDAAAGAENAGGFAEYFGTVRGRDVMEEPAADNGVKRVIAERQRAGVTSQCRLADGFGVRRPSFQSDIGAGMHVLAERKFERPTGRELFG
ncbi:hypothetical protein GCM10009006_21360 [Haloarcula argentinensis]|uniref:Uncharacterized protein n=1 Tax=Haloarcula argentinensis TaxID=43776 RepID=A0A830FN05_HALAR|nr:hypothetical protein GCM10009006_21360 [Haloarcula argentinensis]